MSTRSRAPNGRFSATNATTDPTGGGGEGTQEPDMSANTETEPFADQGAAPDAGDLAGQGGEEAGTDTEPSTDPSQHGSGSDDEEEPTDKDQPDPAQAYRKAAEDGIRDWLSTVTSKDEMGTVVQALRSAGIHIPGIEGEENPLLPTDTSQRPHADGSEVSRSRARNDAEDGACVEDDDPSADTEDERKLAHGHLVSAKPSTNLGNPLRLSNRNDCVLSKAEWDLWNWHVKFCSSRSDSFRMIHRLSCTQGVNFWV